MRANGEVKERILIDDDYFTSLLGDIKTAKHYIDIEMYIFSNDIAGIMLSDALCDAANRGVGIRVLVDGIGTPDWGNAITVKMEKFGISTKVYHPLPWVIRHWHYDAHAQDSITSKFIHLLTKVNSRNHRKLCIIDRKIAYIGSANITDHLINNKGRGSIWRETSVKVSDVQTETLQYAFEKAWGNSKFKKIRAPNLEKINADAIFILNYSWKLRHLYYKSFLNRISISKKRIWVTNSYFVPDNRLLRKLINASNRGVEVRILLPHLSDVLIESLASKIFYSALLKNGVSIYEYLPNVLHAKSLILDNWYLVGSTNLNYRSIRHDLEVNINIQSPEATDILEKQFLVDLENSKKIGFQDIEKQPLYQYLLGRIILIFRYWI